MAVVGRAQVLVAPSFKGFQKEVAGEIPPAGKKAGQGFSGTFSKWAKRGIKVGVGAAAGLIGATLVKGFGRLKAIEEAQAKMRGLGYTADEVETLMSNALASVKGTAFGLGEAATAAASLAAAGIKPGEQMEAVLKSIANSAAAAGVGMDEMSSIYGKVASVGKAQNDVLRQVAEKGIPIYETLAEQLGVTTEEVFKMASAGKIGFKDFEKAMTTASGTVAKEMGETFTGRLSNAWAALGRVGANLLSGVFPKFGAALGRITDALGPLEDKAAELGEALGVKVTKAVQTLLPVFARLGRTALQVGGWMNDHRGVVLGLAAAFGTLTAITKAHAAVLAVQSAGGLLKYIQGIKIVSSLTKVWAAVQWALNIAMSANPIGLVIMGLIALGAGLVIAYKKSETFRNIVNSAFAGIKTVVAAVVNWFTGKALPAMRKVFTAIGNAAKWLWSKAIKPAVNAIRVGWSNLAANVRKVWNGFLRPVFELFGAIVKRLYQAFVRPYINAIRTIWSALGTAVRAVYNRHLKPIVDAFRKIVASMRDSIRARVASIRDYWTGMGTAIRATYNKYLKPTVDTFRAGISKLKSVFKTAVDGIRAQWSKLKSAVGTPIQAVIKFINTHLIGGEKSGGGFNKLARAFGTATMKQLNVPKFQHGGPVPGLFDPNNRDNVLIRAEPGEWYINRRSSKRMEQAFPGYLKYINAHGEPPAFKNGGQVAPVPGQGNRHTSGYPWATWAGDFPNPTGTPIKAWKDGVIAAITSLTSSYGKHIRANHTDGSSSLYAHMSRFASVAVGQAIKAGQTIGYVGSTGNSSGPHLHFETMKGAFKAIGGKVSGALSSVMNFLKGLSPFSWLQGKVKGALKGAFGDNYLGKLMAGVPMKILSSAKEWIGNKFTDGSEDPGGAGVGRWGSTVMRALGIAGLPQTDAYKNAWLRQIQTESGGNPRAVQGNIGDINNRSGDLAKGIVQVIGSTFAAFRDKSLPNDRFNPLANLVAGMNWAKYRYPNMLSMIGRGHGYADGTMSARRGLAWVGERGPELVNFRGREQVFNADMLSRMGEPPVVYVQNPWGPGYMKAQTVKVAEGVVANVSREAAHARSL